MDRISTKNSVLWSVSVLCSLIGLGAAKAEPGVATPPDVSQQCHVKEFIKPIFPEDPYITFAPVAPKVEASLGASSRCSFGVQITLPCMKKLGARLENVFKVNGDEEEGKKLIASFAASEEEMSKSMEGVSFSYTVQEQELRPEVQQYRRRHDRRKRPQAEGKVFRCEGFSESLQYGRSHECRRKRQETLRSQRRA